MRSPTHYETTWPHPRRRSADPVDPRLTRVIRRALHDSVDSDLLPDHIASKVWDWLAEGDQ